MSSKYKKPTYTKRQSDDRFINTLGDQMSGNLRMGNNNLTNINVLCATESHILSSYVHYQDIMVSELSGFRVTGDVEVNGSTFISGSVVSPGGNSSEWNTVYTTITSYVQTNFINSSGDTITGDLDVNGNDLNNVHKISATNMYIGSANFLDTTIVNNVTSTGEFMTVMVNGSALAIPLYTY